MASTYPPREKHGVESLLRLSGLEPLAYRPDAGNMRSTFLKIGERCNVAGSSIYKKAIVDGDFDKALGIAAKQVGPSAVHRARLTPDPTWLSAIGECCNALGLSMCKKVMFEQQFDKALDIAAMHMCGCAHIQAACMASLAFEMAGGAAREARRPAAWPRPAGPLCCSMVALPWAAAHDTCAAACRWSRALTCWT